jgi:hypothetical protein
VANAQTSNNHATSCTSVQYARLKATTEETALKTKQNQITSLLHSSLPQCKQSRTENNLPVCSLERETGFSGVLAQTSDPSSVQQSVLLSQCSTLPTPLNINVFAKLLSGYDKTKSDRLIRGFKVGFIIPSSIEADPDKQGYVNHGSVQQQPHVTQLKLDKEISKHRIAGPFDSAPLSNMIISPIGLVPKKTSGEYRLIHDLSFPKGNSVNSHINPEDTCVEYELLDNCIEIIQSIGHGCLIAKTDLMDAFRIIPLSLASYRLLGFKWHDKYYYDRCLPFGCSSSCQTFESLSQAIQWILINKLSIRNTSHILDDFIFFGAPASTECRIYLHTFMAFAQQVGLPIKPSKTVLPTTRVELHGILVDTNILQVSLPDDKLLKAREMIDNMYRRKKVQLQPIQSLIGVLNFACRVIVPGRAFLRRLINLTLGVTNPSHFIRLNNEARRDLQAWKLFLDQFNGKRLCLPNRWASSNVLRLFTDASGAGFAAIFGSRWIQGSFPEEWSNVNIAITKLPSQTLSSSSHGASSSPPAA